MALYGFITHNMDGVLVQAPCESGEMEHNDSHNCNDNGFALIALATNYGVMARLQPTNIQSQSIIALALIPTLAGLSAYSLSY